MKRIMLTAVLVLLVSVSAHAFDLGGEKFEGSISWTWLSKYVISLGGEANKKQVLNQELYLSHPKSGFYGGIWLSESPNGKKDFGEEQDYYFGKVTDILGISVDTKYQFIAVTKVGDLHELILSITKPNWWPYWKIHALIQQSKRSPHGGFFQEFGLEPTLELPSIYSGIQETLKFDAKMVVNHGAIGINPGLTHAAFKLQFPVSFRDVTITPEIRHQIVFDQFVSKKPGNVNKHRNTTWGGVTLTLRF